MSHSLSRNYIHLVFSTKNRLKILHARHQPEIFSYMSGILSKIKCTPIIVGGVSDHIHILCDLNKNIALTKMVETVKKNSSKWLKTLDITYADFHWQTGYGSFSVSQSKVETVRRYIANQAVHHQQITFKDELVKFLNEYKLEFDEQYLWED